MAFIGNGTVGTIYALATTNITGSEYFTVLGLFIIFLFLGISAKIDMTVLLLGLTPMIIYFLAFNQQFLLIGIIMLIILAYYSATSFFG